MRKEWQNAKRIVIKIGSALLVDEQTGELRDAWMSSLIEDVAALKKQGKEVILVVSGAKALGRKDLCRKNPGPKDHNEKVQSRKSQGIAAGNLTLSQAQAAAAIGQISLAHAFKEKLQKEDIAAAQILLTLSDTENRRQYLNARETINTLIEFGAIPVVNENDTVATNEIRYGDNDRLSARVASMLEAHILIILSDIDGLYTAPPKQDAEARHIEVVEKITPEIEAMAGGAGSSFSSGGMVTKIMAAKIAVGAACHMIITSGKEINPITKMLNGGKATWFISDADPVQSRKSWIAGALDVKGTLTIDQGAENALYKGNSLLPAGVTRADGKFVRGDIVLIVNKNGDRLAQGLTSYSSCDAIKVLGKQSSEIKSILGYSGRTEFVHRDNMALNKKTNIQ